jgi:hypothetical protein
VAAVTPPARLTLPPGYPAQLTDDELAAALDLVLKATQRWSQGNLATFKGEVLAPLLQMGITEQSRRLQATTGRSSFRISMTALAAAILATLIAATFGLLDYYGDKSWQDDQTRILTEIRDSLPPR